MVTDDDKYYSWKGDKDESRLAEIKADMAIAKTVGLRILKLLNITESKLDDMFNKDVGPDYANPGTEMINPRDLKGVLGPQELNPCDSDDLDDSDSSEDSTPPPPPKSNFKIRIPGRGRR
jgi:hypothetical protein